MVDLNRLMYLLRYGSDEEVHKVLTDFIKEAKEMGDEGIRLLRRFFLGLISEPKAKTKIAALKAYAEEGIWDTEIVETIFEISVNDSSIEVRREAERTILELIRRAVDKEKVLEEVIKAIDKRKVRLSPAEAVEASGLEVAKSLSASGKLSPDEKDLLDFGIQYIEEQMNKNKDKKS